MKFLVIGLGSMGKRRVRNLIALGQQGNIAGFDPAEERRGEANNKYSITIFSDFEKAIGEFKPDVFIISTPPNLHMHYAMYAAKKNINCFIEASVVDSEKILELNNISVDRNIVMAPSCTMRFYPGPLKIKELVSKGVIGKPLNFNYQTGQYLPDWHPWEDIKDFYVSNPHTGGCREIVPFELTWINDIFGNPAPVACMRGKLTDLPADIEDIYHCLLKYPDSVFGNLTVEVISRPRSTREFRLIGTTGELVFSSDTNSVKYININMKDWEEFKFDSGTIEAQYINPEEPYVNEIKEFLASIDAVKSGKKSSFPNTLLDDYNVLQVLYKLEEISEGIDELSR